MSNLDESPNELEKTPKRVVKANYDGSLELAEGGIPLEVAVLEDGTRLIGRNAIFRAFGRTKRGRAIGENRAANLPSFVDAKNLTPYISDNLYEILTNPIKCKTKSGSTITGYRAEVLPLLCDTYLDADKEGKLTGKQRPLAEQALIIVRALSKIGIIALIDEATGYQYDREKDELQQILKAYISVELLPWQKTFPDLFYKELFRLNGWEFTVKGIKKRPGVIGTWTKKLVYEQLPPGVLKELKEKTPKSAAGNYTARFFQSLTADTGNPHLTAQINQILTLFQLSDDMQHMWAQFRKLKARQNGQLEIPFEFDDKGHTKEPNEPVYEKGNLSDFNNKLMKAIEYDPKSKT